MFTLSISQLAQWTDAFMWPFLRVGAMWMLLPIFGSAAVPARIRLVLAVATTLLLLPLLPPPPPMTPFSAVWTLTLIQQIALGAVMALVLQFVFEAVLLGGQLIAMAMGLGFAEMSDPLRGVSSPVVSQYLSMVATLLFLAIGGHLIMFQWLAFSFQSLPVESGVLSFADLWVLASWGGGIFAGAVQIALPAIIALLLVNLAFGVISRSAPSLNLLSIGFPAALLFGLLLLLFSMPVLAAVFQDMLAGVWLNFEDWLGR